MTLESLLAGLYDGLRLAAIVICVGAANSLANPKRLLRSVPPALYEVGTALVVAVTMLPQFADSLRRVRAAQALRGGESGRVRGLRRLLVPVLEDALERSLALAAGMDARGYGRAAGLTPAERRRTGALMLGGLLGICVGTYALLDRTAPRLLALPMLALGVAVAVAGLASAGRRVERTRYRPDPWRWPEFVVMASGVVAGATGWWVSTHQVALAYPALDAWPQVSGVALAGLLVALGGGAVRPAAGGAARAARGARRPARGGGGVIELHEIGFGYDDERVLDDVDLVLEEGELLVVSGPTGVGKSTLLGVVTGLVPRFSGGALAGDVRLDGESIVRRPPRERAHVVGYVGQDPAAGFVTDTVEEELAYGMEQLGLPPETMRRRVEETLDLLGIAALRDRDLTTLSGGEQQRVAIGSVLTMHPRVLVLDEPTSALDPTAAEEVMATLARLVHDLGISVLMAEHRLERVVPFADRIALLPGDGSRRGRRARRGARHLARRTAHRRARPRRRLGPAAADGARRPPARPRPGRPAAAAAGATACARRPPARCSRARGVTVTHGRTVALREVDVDLRPGAVTALMGRNGSGKSTLLWTLQGTTRRRGGTGRRRRPGPRRARAGRSAAAWSGWCRRPPPTCSTSRPSTTSAEPPTAARVPRARRSTGWRPASPATATRATSPRASGSRSRWRWCSSAAPRVVLLDEPTRGLDYPGKAALAAMLRELAATGHAVLVATHDVEFVAQVADDVVVLAEGEVVSSGPVLPGGGRVAGLRTAGDQGARTALAARRPGRAAARRDRAGAVRAPRATSTAAVRLTPRSAAVLGTASLAGLMMLGWPLLLRVGDSTRVDPPFVFLALLPVVVAVVLAEVSEGGLDPRVLAILGVLSAANALLRGLSAGTGGVELVFFLLILAGRVFGPGFGFALGCTSLFASALMTAGVGPWLPFQMLVSAWVGMGAGPAAAPLHRSRRDRAARGVRRGRVLRLRPADEPLVVALRARHPGLRRAGVARVRRRRPARREPPPLPRLHAADLDRLLRHRPRDHHRRRDHPARPGDPHHPAPGLAAGAGDDSLTLRCPRRPRRPRRSARGRRATRPSGRGAAAPPGRRATPTTPGTGPPRRSARSACRPRPARG